MTSSKAKQTNKQYYKQRQDMRQTGKNTFSP